MTLHIKLSWMPVNMHTSQNATNIYMLVFTHLYLHCPNYKSSNWIMDHSLNLLLSCTKLQVKAYKYFILTVLWLQYYDYFQLD